MSLCLAAGALSVALGWSNFTLAWTHSVEKTEWQEDYRVTGDFLTTVEVRVKGSGAGVDPGEDAVLRDGWWVYHPPRLLQELRLARSDAVPDWRLCHDGSCTPLSTYLRAAPLTETVTLTPCR